VGKPEGKRPLGRHRHRGEDNIKMDVFIFYHFISRPLARPRRRWEDNIKMDHFIFYHFISRPLARPRSRIEDNIKMDLQEVGCGGYGLDRAGSV